MPRDGKLERWGSQIPSLKPVAEGVNLLVSKINGLETRPGPKTHARGVHGVGSGSRAMESPSQKVFPVKITASLGNGNYSARWFYGVPAYTAGSAVYPGTVNDPGYDNVIAVNAAEVLGGAVLPIGSWAIAVLVGVATSAAGTPVPLVMVASGAGGAFPAQITGSSLISANLWSYTFSQAQPTTSAGGWQLVSGGITGTAYNTIEAGNAATGTLSTGWNPANFCSTNITLQPIRTGAVVMMAPVLNCATPPANVYVFQAANVIDGAC